MDAIRKALEELCRSFPRVDNPAGFLTFFVFIWLLAVFLLSALGGWRKLQKAYRKNGDFGGRILSFQSANIGNVNYGNCIKIGMDERELFLGVFIIFRLFHPDLLIPLTEVSGREIKKYLFFKFVELTFQEAPGVKVRITKSLADTLEKESAGSWRYKRI